MGVCASPRPVPGGAARARSGRTGRCAAPRGLPGRPGPAAPWSPTAPPRTPPPGDRAPRCPPSWSHPDRSPPPAASTMPRPQPGDRPRTRSASENAEVRPSWSAQRRNSTAPACPTRPLASAAAFSRRAHPIVFDTRKVPHLLEQIRTRHSPPGQGHLSHLRGEFTTQLLSIGGWLRGRAVMGFGSAARFRGRTARHVRGRADRVWSGRGRRGF